MILEPLRPGLIAQVAYNMRARDREEFAALGLVFSWMPERIFCDAPLSHSGAQSISGHSWSGEEAGRYSTEPHGLSTSQLAERLALARYGFVACANDATPIAVCAGEEHLPGLVGWSFFATARLNEIGLALTRHLRRSRDLCVLKRFGAGGQDFILWELTDDDVRKSLLQPQST